MKKGKNHVCCPKCSWTPDGGKHWQCLCGHTWDVFSTGGRCPACFRQWEKTQCVPRAGGCKTWSPHLDWYGDLNTWLHGQLSEIKEEQKERRGSRG